MSEENVEKLRQFLAGWDPKAYLEAWHRGDADTSLFDPEIAYEDTVLPDHVGEVYRGMEGLVRATERWIEPLDSMVVELERIVGSGDRLVSIQVGRAKAHHTGLDFEERYAYVWTFRDGKVIHLKSYLEATDALEDAGLSD
jgi:ketosteroid isomerase-like protein